MTYHNGDSGGNGGNGSNGGGPIMNTPGGGGGVQFSWADSAYKFTNPPRYYKANDPYYYEVDNIPLKQLQQNCLWLRDQITGGSTGISVSGITKRNIEDLKPSVNGMDRFVTVQPGNFIGRVNDPTDISHEGYWVGTAEDEVDFSRNNILSQPGYRISQEQWRFIVDDISAESAGVAPFGIKANGLFSHYTFHGGGGMSPEGYDTPVIPLTTTAMWKNILAGDLAGSVDLDMAFRRRWAGVFRTATVNVANPLSIQIPPFDDGDFMDNAEVLDPQIRIDLLCIYTVPVDKTSSTTVLNSAYNNSLARPELVLVKGAGGILAPRVGAEDIASDPSLIPDILDQDSLSPKYYNTSGGLEGDASLAIKANLQDQISGGVDAYASTTDKVPLGSFPSPDDLLNIAPLIAENVASDNIQLIGQSVLPLAYIVVHKNQLAIKDVDIIDIRPFMRTTEMTYNERAGVAAANPPLSFANPVVGKGEMYSAFEGFKEYLIEYVDDQSTGGAFRALRPTFVASFDESDFASVDDDQFCKMIGYNAHDDRGVANYDTDMTAVNSGNVFGFVPFTTGGWNPNFGGAPDALRGVIVVRGSYLIKSTVVLNVVQNAGGQLWPTANYLYTFKLTKTPGGYGSGNTPDQIWPITITNSDGTFLGAEAWRVGPGSARYLKSQSGGSIGTQTVTLTCNMIFVFADNDFIRFTYRSNNGNTPNSSLEGGITIERLPDDLIS